MTFVLFHRGGVLSMNGGRSVGGSLFFVQYVCIQGLFWNGVFQKLIVENDVKCFRMSFRLFLQLLESFY